MFINGSILYHSKAIQRNLERFDATATIDLNRFALHLWGRNRYYQFTAQFLRKENGKNKYTIHLPEDPRGFVGWLPYFNKRWDIATDKLPFKEYCLANGLACPAFSASKTDTLPGFLIKRRRSSFGVGIRGPFRKFDSSNAAHLLREGEYYDQFISGKVGKAWYWNDKLVCCEMRRMSEIAGDGVHTIRHFIEAHLGKYGFTPEWEDFVDTLEFHGSSLDHVPGDGQCVVADFRFGSMLMSPDWKNHNVVRELRESELGNQLLKAGPVFWRGIPEEIRQSTLYTVDFVVDEEHRAWFLEMNCNPQVHPDIYPDILEDLLGSPKNIPVGAPTPPAQVSSPPIHQYPGQGAQLLPFNQPPTLGQPGSAFNQAYVFPPKP